MDPLSVEAIELARVKLLENAKSLVNEARILYEAGCYPRTFALSQLALEELSKIMTVVRLGLRVSAGQPVDWKNADRRLRDHKGKSRLIFWYLSCAEEDPDACEAVKTMGAVLSNMKNWALYVGFEEGQPVSPSDIITRQRAYDWLSASVLALCDFCRCEKKTGGLIDECARSEEYQRFCAIYEAKPTISSRGDAGSDGQAR